MEENETRRRNRDREVDRGDQEVEVINGATQPQRQEPLFSFKPLNPNNAGAEEYDEVQGLTQNFPLTSRHLHQENQNQSPAESQLNVFGIPVEFPQKSVPKGAETTNWKEREVSFLHRLSMQ